jgi:predicted dehydrogenase
VPTLKSVPDIATICRDTRVDIVLVLTPPDARRSLIAPLASAGKAILLEKPVGRTLDEAEEVVTFCEAAGVPLGIVFQHRMREASIAALALVDSGTLGALGPCGDFGALVAGPGLLRRAGRGTFARDGGGVLISQAIHTIDLALTLTGPVAEVRAMTGTTRLHRMEAEDVAVVGLRFANGGLGWLTASTAELPRVSESITLHFEKASLRLAEGVLQVHWRDGRSETHGAAASTGGGADPMAFTHDWHTWVLEDFAARRGEGRPPAIPGREALAAHRADPCDHGLGRGWKTVLIQRNGCPMSITFRCHRNRSSPCLWHDRTPDRRRWDLRGMVDGGVNPGNRGRFRETVPRSAPGGRPAMRCSTAPTSTLSSSRPSHGTAPRWPSRRCAPARM